MFESLVILLLVALVATAATFGLPWLADESILVTRVTEGTAKAIMRGNSFERMVMSYKGHRLNDPKGRFDASQPPWEVLSNGNEPDESFDSRNWLLKKLGLFWVGWPWSHSVYVYPFGWNETRTKTDGTEEIWARHEPTDFVYVNDFVYAIVTSGAETKDRLATDELTLVTAAVVNPYKALFRGEDWMRRVTAANNREARDFVAIYTFDDIIEKRDEWDAYSQRIVTLSEELPDDKPDAPEKGLHGRYGVLIRAADLQQIDLSGDSKKKNVEATAAEYVAKQEKKATIARAEGEADAIRKVGQARADAAKVRLEVIREAGDTGITLAGLDALEAASKNPSTHTIWANNPLGGLINPKKGD